MRQMKFLATIFLVFALLIPAKADAATIFKDVPKDFPAAKGIYHFAELGIIRGYEDGTFRPNDPVTRSQAAIILAGALQLETENLSTIDYKDVKKNAPAYGQIAAITNAGIMKGDKGKFLPNKPLTRAQMAIILTNALELEGDKKTSFKDVPKDFHAYNAIDAIFTNGITTGFGDGTFKPNKPTTRAQLLTFLARALADEPSVTELLNKAYANEQEIDTYTFNGNVNLGLTFPETLDSPEMGMILDMFKDIKVDITGAYQKDPMMMEATVDLTLSGEIQTTISVPIVITEEKLWFKIPNSPLIPLPEELAGKYVEFDLNELQELEGLPTGSIDIDLQTELALAINQLFLKQFADDFYNGVESNSIKVPSDIDVKKVVKFELTNESLQPFFETLMKGFIPQFFELIQEPKYANSLGLTIEAVEMAKEEIEKINENIDEIIQQINEVLSISTFEQYIVINQDDFIAYNSMNMDLDITVEETFGIKILSNQAKSNINEDVKFAIGIPDKADVITFDELLDLTFDYDEELEFDFEDLEL